MRAIEKSLRDMIAFSKKKRAAEMRRLSTEGKGKKSARTDAYATIIAQLAAILPEDEADEEEDVPDQPNAG